MIDLFKDDIYMPRLHGVPHLKNFKRNFNRRFILIFILYIIDEALIMEIQDMPVK